MTAATDLLAEFGIVRPSWQANAACAPHAQAAWYPGKGHTARSAYDVCAGCPVLAQCLEHALTRREKLGVWGGAAWRLRRRLAVVWIQRAHDYRPDCRDEACRWCRTVDEHRLSLLEPSDTPMQLNGPGARHGFRATYARGCRCGPCSFARSPAGRRLHAVGVDVAGWWGRWFGADTIGRQLADRTRERLIAHAKRLAEFDATESESEAA